MLVVAAEPAIRALLVRIFRGDLEIVAAGTPAEAMALVHERRPDLAIIDVSHPERTALDLCRSLREELSSRSMPIVALTARGLVAEAVAARVAGADYLVEKPFSPSRLKELVGAVLTRREQTVTI
ncbi:MAG: response regulator [Chloroflexi bacterium]|nr:response regulator [Chloroflexota bacterium]